MNEGEESIPSKETRKKRRGSRIRYSSKKDLDCSRLRRKNAKVGGYELASITKALLFPGALSCGSATGLGGPHYLDRIVEHDEEKIEICLIQ